MASTLAALHRLQSIENKLRALREKVESRNRIIRSRQQRSLKLEREMAEVRQSIQQAQAAADRLELDRKSREEHITKLREALNRTKSNKEYAALLTQLNTEKADLMKLEDGVLKALSRVDEEKGRITLTQTALDKERAGSVEMDKASQEALQKVLAEVKACEAERESATAEVPVSVLVLFERACERHEGEAMARLEKVHPKRAEYVCSGCNMSIPLEVVNALQTRSDIQQCQICSRILYLEGPDSKAM